MGELGVVLLLVLGAVAGAFWVAAGADGPQLRSGAWVTEVRKAVTGRITAEQSLAIVLAMLALNATINVALAIPQNLSQLRPHEQVSLMEWRNWLDLTSLLAASVAVLAGIAAWLGPTIRSTSLISVFTDAAALLCVALMVSITQATSNAAEREINRAWARKQRRLVLVCKRLLPPSSQPPLWRGRRLAIRLAATGLLITLATAMVSTVAWWVLAALTYDSPLQPGWITGAAMIELMFCALSVLAVGLSSFLRWSWYHTPHARLNIVSWGIRIAYVLFCTTAIGLTAATTSGPSIANSVMFWLPIVGLPIVMWWVIGRTRRDSLASTWMRSLAAPLWSAVSASLDNQARKRRHHR
ncbi:MULTISPECIES: hypothetical protein [unclassified Nocardia]|uniref:hypothetical protein n=1 Tax=unclassified Nocardia TaxID=2637762 RepID=UPI00278C0E7D|nr:MULTISPECIES: hypothetical protein [unclassified Nocardia]